MKRSSLMTVAATGAFLSVGALAHAADYTSTTRAAPATQENDIQITDNVKSKLEANDADVASAIVVSTHDGVVTLKGVALNNDYIAKAIFDARSVAGVVQVKNELSVG